MNTLMDATCGTVAKSNPQDRQQYLPVWMHLQDIAGIMERLYQEWLPDAIRKRLEDELGEDTALKYCCMLALLHDIGKITALFQTNIQCSLDGYMLCTLPVPENSRKYGGHNVPHARAGEAILLKYGFPKSFAAIVGAHHGKPQDSVRSAEIAIEEGPMCFYGAKDANDVWECCWENTIREAMDLCGIASPTELPEISMSAQMILTGLLVMADWLASNTTYFPLISIEECGEPECYPERVEAAWAAVSLPTPWSSEYSGMNEEVFHNKFSFYPNRMQKKVLEIVDDTAQPGIFILESGMGSGKTEAALALAEVLAQRTQSGGLFFGLPTQATANGLFSRIKTWAEQQSQDEKHGIRLAHGASALNAEYQELFHGSAHISEDEDSGLVVHSWFEGRKQALLSEFVVGTVDQLLMASLKSKHLMLRHLGLAGKVVIIDEVHSYSVHMNAYLDRTLTWLGEYGVPVIILSATLPEERRTAIIRAYLQGRSHQSRRLKPEDAAWQHELSYPLLTWTDSMDVSQTAVKEDKPATTVLIEHETLENLPERLKNELSDGGCAGVIVNTVYRAQTVATRLRETLPEMRVIVFHSQFVAADRAERERMLLNLVGKNSGPEQRDGLIIVGSQVLEQSLDLDFDLLCTDLCPMDLLLQRIGRLHRHKQQHDAFRPKCLRSPRCLVMEADGELESGAKSIYGGAWLLNRTKQFVPERITLPQDIPILVQNAYRTPDVQTLSEQEYEDWRIFSVGGDMEKSEAQAYLLIAPKHSKYSCTLDGILNVECSGTEENVQRSVRGGDVSIEVLVLQWGEDGCLYRLDEPETPLYADHVPSSEECLEIAKQRLRLAARFSKRWNVENVISELEQKTAVLAEWQQSPWLRGELFLLLDSDRRTALHGTQLYYSAEDGLCIEKEEENAGKGI